MPHQLSDYIFFTIESCDVKSSHAQLPAQIPQRNVLLDKLRDDGGVAISSCQVHRSHPCLVLIQWRGSISYQQLHHISVTPLRGNMERSAVSELVPARGHDILVKLQQLLQHSNTAFLSSNVS